jgi:hypothetical protein
VTLLRSPGGLDVGSQLCHRVGLCELRHTVPLTCIAVARKGASLKSIADRGVLFGPAAAHPILIRVGAGRPKMLRLVGRKGDAGRRPCRGSGWMAWVEATV